MVPSDVIREQAKMVKNVSSSDGTVSSPCCRLAYLVICFTTVRGNFFSIYCSLLLLK